MGIEMGIEAKHRVRDQQVMCDDTKSLAQRGPEESSAVQRVGNPVSRWIPGPQLYDKMGNSTNMLG